MAFIRRRMYPEEKRKGRWKAAARYQLVATYREGGKVKQRVASLGKHPTVEEALHAFRKSVAGWEGALARNEEARGWRAHRRRDKRRAEINADLALARARLAKVEAVVSTTSRRRDTLDTTATAAPSTDLTP
jgi:hypothetical protein